MTEVSRNMRVQGVASVFAAATSLTEKRCAVADNKADQSLAYRRRGRGVQDELPQCATDDSVTFSEGESLSSQLGMS